MTSYQKLAYASVKFLKDQAKYKKAVKPFIDNFEVLLNDQTEFLVPM